MVFNSPMPGTPQTGTKANVGALTVAAATVVLYVLARLTGWVEAPAEGLFQDAVTSLVMAIASAIVTRVMVYMTPNKPLAILLPLLLAGLLLGGGLVACAPAGAGPGQTKIERAIAIGESYVNLGIDIADACVRRQVPLCVGREAEIAQAKAVALEAIVEAKRYAAEGQSEDLIQATIRIGMNAVLLLYTFQSD